MRLVFGRDDDVAAWTSEHLGMAIYPPYTAIGIEDLNGQPCGGAVFTDWNGSNIEIAICGPGAMKRGVVRAAFHYVFIQIGANRLTAKTKRSNKLMCRMLPKFGFEFEATLKRYYGAQRENDALVFRLDPITALKWM